MFGPPEPELFTVIIQGTQVAASASSVYDHGVSAGEYMFEQATIKPSQDPLQVPAWCSFAFYPSLETRDGRVIYFGAGYANENRWPLVIRGPVPFTGPGFFRAICINANVNDVVGGNFSFRKVRKQ